MSDCKSFKGQVNGLGRQGMIPYWTAKHLCDVQGLMQEGLRAAGPALRTPELLTKVLLT